MRVVLSWSASWPTSAYVWTRTLSAFIADYTLPTTMARSRIHSTHHGIVAFRVRTFSFLFSRVCHPDRSEGSAILPPMHDVGSIVSPPRPVRFSPEGYALSHTCM